ncbi:MAG TPA: hypothetical protein VFO79_03145, partial [Xanthomonadales bacterium]|nr:hypothetical protein [Xanthomonadales bacterium]
MNFRNAWVAAGCVALLVLSACSRKAPEGTFAYVPADTPYVFANREPLPQAIVDEWNVRFAPLAAAYEKMLSRAVLDLAKQEGADERSARGARAVLEELKGNVSFEGLGRLGFDLRGHWAFYGVGLVPVARWELRDPDAFRAFIGRVEQRWGEKIPVAKAGDLEYWRVAGGEGELAALFAVSGKQVVATLAPGNASESLVRRLLGVDRPDDALEPDVLEKLDSEYGFVPYGSGWIDVVRTATLLLDEKTGIEKEFLAALKIEDKPADPVCRGEMLAIAAKFPRAVVGYTRFDAKAVDQVAVLELPPALAAEFVGIAAPVPGLGASGDALVDFGMSLKLDKLKAAV